MTVYLLHLDQPVSRGVSPAGKPLTAGHYIGYADDVVARIDEHVSTTWEPLPAPVITDEGKKICGVKHGNGSTFIGFVNFLGVNWRLVRTWDGADRDFERQLKNLKKARKLCPVCDPINAWKRMHRHLGPDVGRE